MSSTSKQNTIACSFLGRQLVMDQESIMNLLTDELKTLQLNTFADDQIYAITSRVMTEWEFDIDLDELDPEDIAFKYWEARMDVLKMYYDLEELASSKVKNKKNALFVGVTKLMPVVCDLLYKVIIKKVYEYATSSSLETPNEFNN